MMPFNCSHRNKNVSKHRVRLISLVPFVWESNPKLQGGWCKTEPPDHRGSAAHPGGAGTREEPGTLTGCACSPWFVSFGLFGLCTRVFPGYLGIRKAKDNAASWMREVQVEISYKFHKTILNTRGYCRSSIQEDIVVFETISAIYYYNYKICSVMLIRFGAESGQLLFQSNLDELRVRGINRTNTPTPNATCQSSRL